MMMQHLPIEVSICDIAPEKTGIWQAIPSPCGVVGTMADLCYRVIAPDNEELGLIEWWNGDLVYFVSSQSLQLPRVRRQTIEECILYLAQMWVKQTV
ncbi:MAG: hypothetical protein SFW36_08890 [Leptolyngbyaceae cyanobacterium bins.59]|nr:hypothetical protein [Leptolyngbyaceae cyanobacterium bins.59]